MSDSHNSCIYYYLKIVTEGLSTSFFAYNYSPKFYSVFGSYINLAPQEMKARDVPWESIINAAQVLQCVLLIGT